MNLNQITVFINVVESGSFSGAASLLGMPRSTVSRKVSQLEDALGVQLLLRSTRKLSLTGAGNDYFLSCREALAQIRQANENISSASVTPSGTLRIAAPLAAQRGFMCDWINAFSAAYENVSLEIILSDDNADMIGDRIDVAFRAGKLEDSSLIARRLGHTRLVICASPDYLKSSRAISSLKDLRHHECLSFGNNNRNSAWRLIGNRGVESVHVRSRLQVNSMEFVLQSCLAGLGLAILPVAMISDYISSKQLSIILPEYASEADGMYVVYPDRHHQSASARAFVEFIVKQAKNGLPWD